MKNGNLQKQQNGLKSTNHSKERDLLTPCQRTMKNRSPQNGSKSSNHSDERDPLTPLNSFYSFSKTTARLIDGRENATIGGDLNFRFRMLLKGAVSLMVSAKFPYHFIVLILYFCIEKYCKIPIISPSWAYICSKGFLLGLFSGELIFGGAYYWKEFCVSKWVKLDNKNSLKH